MGKSVKAEELVVVSEALTQIVAEAVIDRASIGVVCVHVAERDAVLVGRGVAIGVEALAGETDFDGLCAGLARTSARSAQTSSDVWVHSSRAEEIHQGSTDPGAERTRATGAACATTDRKWTGRGLTGSERRIEVGHHQVAAT